ncbi:hypothetical protein K1719_037427 [Acacia pycnantha]|nr:hypothetical protein K1719_037427 [Acacia pycnantha]
MDHNKISLFLEIHIACFVFCSLYQHTSGLTETEALLRWKQSLPWQPILDSWVSPPQANSSAVQTPCSWRGIKCDSKGTVVELNLNNTGLKGTLKNLNFSAFPNLVLLNLKFNQLIGPIPESIGLLSKLQFLDLNRNYLNGTIPLSLSNLTQLYELDLSQNYITGILDPRLFPDGSDEPKTGLIGIKYIVLQGLLLGGKIPNEIGNLKQLTILALYQNSFYGPIPLSFGNCTHLNILSLAANSFSGTIPPILGRLPNLTDVRVFINNFSGPLPQWFQNRSFAMLNLSNNNFTGHLPPQVCKDGGLLEFTAAYNSFTGPIPMSLRNCTSLVRLRLEHNQLTGDVDKDFGVYPNLTYIDLSYNRLQGMLSTNWGACKSLQNLNLAGNSIMGILPGEIFQLKHLQKLDLSSNLISGEIPPQIGITSTLYHLHLGGNNLSGLIPKDIGKLSSLQSLDLSMNSLRGPIPYQIGDCYELLNLNLSNNYFTGQVPYQIGNLVALQDFLDLSYNSLSGEIPVDFSKLNKLISLNMSRNNLSGPIPNFLATMLSLSSINLSHNNLEGPVPDSGNFNSTNPVDLSNNKNLCGRIQGLKPCNISTLKSHGGTNRKKMVIAITSSLAVAFFLLGVIGIFIVLYERNPRAVEHNTGDSEENLFFICHSDGNIMYEDIIETTGNFAEKYCIGEGAFGKVYKLILPGEKKFAVKKLICEADNLDMESIKAFKSEIKALTETRHRNIVKLYGFCKRRSHTFLIYEYMERGSLADILKNDEEASELDWSKRFNIILGVAQALCYMHHDCDPPIVHRDISSKNILLSSNLEAHVSDFGTARFLKADSSIWTTFAGTYGYAAPELAYTMAVTEKVDVYSFGVLAIEVLMGEHPGDLMSRSLTYGINQINFKEILDPRLSSTNQQNLKKFSLIWHLALSCLQANPQSRPTMRGVAQLMEMESSPKT